ncbi:MAG: redox-regulated ATPase YchF [Candidatus Omnitrophica bacterium]|nr:redox-regulated ATPase YchF [Candidatus Omnitrophota bacterium]
MKIGIIGLPQTGKKTLFEVLTGYTCSDKDLASNKPIKSVAEIYDARFDALVGIYRPKKSVRARIDFELLPKIEQDTIAKGEIFKDIINLDAICHVVRAFHDDAIYHIKGSVDAARDIETINAELVLHDLVFIEKRLERLENTLRKIADKSGTRERDLLIRLKEQLEKEMPLRLLTLDKDEKKIISGYPFITLKKMLIVLNVSEDKLGDTAFLGQLTNKLAPLGIDSMQVCAKVESEIRTLETEAEKKEFLEALGIQEPAINILTGLSMKALDLISFFTASGEEVRQWTVPANSLAPEAAGTIHSDMERGFIRAEVMKYGEFIAAGSEEKLKEAGKFYVKGKDYIVEDGDILHIRFSV